MFSQLLISGLSFGSLYALIALAMVIIYKTSEVPNFGQGEMAMLSTFVAYSLLVTHDYSFAVAFVGALLFAAALGVFLEFVFLRRAKDPNILSLILITLGFEMMLYGLASWKWGADQRDLPFPVSDFDIINVGPAVISYLNIATLLITLVLMLILFLFFKYTKVGIAMKATQQNAMAARINGIRTNRILSITWAHELHDRGGGRHPAGTDCHPGPQPDARTPSEGICLRRPRWDDHSGGGGARRVHAGHHRKPLRGLRVPGIQIHRGFLASSCWSFVSSRAGFLPGTTYRKV